METPKSCYVYEFSYPEEMPELAGIVFYVGQSVSSSRMDNHLREASNNCECAKCEAIRSIWEAGLIPTRRIVFESASSEEVINEERRRILQHQSPHLTNVVRTQKPYKQPSYLKEEATQMALPLSTSNPSTMPTLIVDHEYDTPIEDTVSETAIARSMLRSMLRHSIEKGILKPSEKTTMLLLSDWPN